MGSRPTSTGSKSSAKASGGSAARPWKTYVASEAGQTHQERVLPLFHAFRLATTASLLDEGLVPTKLAAELLYCAPTTLRSGTITYEDPQLGTVTVTLEPRTFGKKGKVVRFGANARDVLHASPHKDARRELSKPLAVLNRTKVGRPVALSEVELASIIRLRSADPETWGWRTLAARVNEARPPGARQVSYVTVKRAFERVTAPRPAQ